MGGLAQNIVIVSNNVMNVLVNEYPSKLQKLTEMFPPVLYGADFRDINKVSGKKGIHSLLFRNPDEARIFAKMMNDFAMKNAGFLAAIYGEDFTEEDILALKNGEFMFEVLPCNNKRS